MLRGKVAIPNPDKIPPITQHMYYTVQGYMVFMSIVNIHITLIHIPTHANTKNLLVHSIPPFSIKLKP